MCSLSSFPLPPQRGHKTVCEIDGRLIVSSNEASVLGLVADKLQEYPKVTITKSSLNPTISKESVKSVFISTSETRWTKILSTLNEDGIFSAIEELTQNGEILSSALIRNVAGFFLAAIRRIQIVQSSIYPHFRVQNNKKSESVLETRKFSDDEIIEKFSPANEWRDGLIRCFCWHPHTLKFAVAQRDDTIKIFSSPQRINLILKHRQQQMISDLSWRPLSSSTLAVACRVGVVVWTIDPTSVVSRPSSSCVQVLIRSGHSPVTSVRFSPCGRLLVSASPLDKSMIVWDVTTQIGVPLKRVTGGCVSFVRWSPDGQRLFEATTSKVFRVWETKTWTSDFWSSGTGRCRAACWSPDGAILLAAMDNEPLIYSMSFTDSFDETSNSVGGSKAAVPVVNLAEVEFDTEIVGGFVQSMVWDKSGQRLAVSLNCKDSRQEMVVVFRTKTKPILDITPCGFVRGSVGDEPQFIGFQDSFQGGALLTICWSSGEINHIPFFFPEHFI